MEVTVYIVGKKSGQFASDGTELIIVYDVKLTHAAASALAAQQGLEVFKMRADKIIPHTTNQ